MPDFETVILSAKDGTWDAFRADWEKQCEEVGEQFDDYSPDSLTVIAGIVSGGILSPGSGGMHAGALRDNATGKFYACCSLHAARLPNTDGITLRVRHLLVSPLIDYGVAEVRMYPDVVIGVMLGIIHVSSNVLVADHIQFHLRSPEDMDFFRTFGLLLGGSNVFASVQTRGSWLYISKSREGGPSIEEETK